MGAAVQEQQQSSSVILIVDDSKNIRKTMSMALSSRGFATLTAADGVEALELVKKNSQIKLIFLDIDMPLMNGYQFVQKITSVKQERGLKVCFISGMGQKEDILKAISLGGDDYIVKPIDDEILLNKVEALIEVPEPQAQRFARVDVHLMAHVLEGPVRPDIIVTNISEVEIRVRASAELVEGETLYLHCPTLNNVMGFGCELGVKVHQCTRKRFGLYHAELTLVGASERLTNGLRSIAVKGEFITDD